MSRDLSHAIGEIEERVTALRFRAASVDLSPDAMLDEVARLLHETRELMRRVPAAPSPVPDHPPAAARGEDDWSELLPDPFFRTDANGVVTVVNSAGAEMLHVPKYFITGRPLTMFLDTECRPAMRAQLVRLGSAVSIEPFEVSFRQSSGQPVIGSLSAMAAFENGSVPAIRWLFRPGPLERQAGEEPLPGESPGRRTAFLATMSGVLARSLDYQRTLEALAVLSIPLLGDWCIVDILDEHGVAHRLAASSAPAEPREMRSSLLARAPVLQSDRTVLVDVLRGGPGRIIRAGTPGFPAPLAATAEEHVLLEELGVVSALIVPLAARGQTLGAVTFLMSGSRRRHGAGDLALAEELAARAGVLADNARLYHAAQQASQAKSDFLAAMSHELRTPLTAVIGYTEILADEIVGPLKPIQKEQLTRIRASSEHLLILVEEILTFARLEAGREQLSLQSVDLHDMVDQALTLITVQARARQLEVVVDVPPRGPRFISDAAKLRQILVNLLANAVKFTPRGQVGIRAREVDGWVHFEVWDTGIGIKPEHLDRIFAPFWQVDQKATRSYGGSGLGLAVVRKLSRLLGGDVAVQSEPGKGSRFEVRLPLAGPSDELSEDARSDGRPAPPSS